MTASKAAAARSRPLNVRRAGGMAKKGRDNERTLAARHVRPWLPGLHRFMQGKQFRAHVFRTWLRTRLRGKGFKLPSVEDSAKLLESLARSSLGTWQPRGIRYSDPEGPGSVDNVQGYARGPARLVTPWVAWNEYGFVFRLKAVSTADRRFYEVISVKSHKRLSCHIQRRSVGVSVEAGKQVEFKSSVLFEPRQICRGIGPKAAPWTLIYLHSFSNKASEYIDYPHYFGVDPQKAALRVILPTAPQQEQTCFKDWKVWKGERLQWRRIKFTSWFDYLTDKAGKSENGLDLQTLLDMRTRLHALIRKEVQRVGDPKHVILGGASQGCCVALDAALTYPDELGGVIGLVGHVLGSTPLDPAKRRMPLHLFHEVHDKEMDWRWVGSTVQRLIDAGFNVHSRHDADPTGSGHWIQDIEGHWIRSALRRLVHPAKP